jgi:hypothetical protein
MASRYATRQLNLIVASNRMAEAAKAMSGGLLGFHRRFRTDTRRTGTAGRPEIKDYPG